MANHVSGLHPLVNARVAVKIFFVISGFYMAFVTDSKYKLDKSGIKKFYTNRLLRLYPTYFLSLLLAGAAAILCSSQPNNPYTQFFERYRHLGLLEILAAVGSNFFIFGQDALLYLGIGDNGHFYFTSNYLAENSPAWKLQLNPPSWSLALEGAFYLLVPFIAKLNTKVLVSIVVFCALFRFALAGSLPVFNDPWIYRFFPFELGMFVCGMLCYRIWKFYGEALKKPSLVLSVICYAGLVVLIVCQKLPFSSIYIPYLFMPLLPILFSITKSVGWDRKIGEYSYPVYIFHWPVIALVERFRLPATGLISIAVTFLLSAIVIHFVEGPIDQFRHSLINRKTKPSA